MCANCHREIHNNLLEIDVNKQYFDENAVQDYECAINKVTKYNKFCSRKCAAKSRDRVNWEQYESLVYIIDNKIESINSIASKLNISWQAVKKRYKKLKSQ